MERHALAMQENRKEQIDFRTANLEKRIYARLDKFEDRINESLGSLNKTLTGWNGNTADEEGRHRRPLLVCRPTPSLAPADYFLM